MLYYELAEITDLFYGNCQSAVGCKVLIDILIMMLKIILISCIRRSTQQFRVFLCMLQGLQISDMRKNQHSFRKGISKGPIIGAQTQLLRDAMIALIIIMYLKESPTGTRQEFNVTDQGAYFLSKSNLLRSNFFKLCIIKYTHIKLQ